LRIRKIIMKMKVSLVLGVTEISMDQPRKKSLLHFRAEEIGNDEETCYSFQRREFDNEPRRPH